jgi:hypothetical protein
MRLAGWRALAAFAPLLLAALLALPGRGVIIDSGDGSGNTTAPPDDPGWAYLGRVASGLSAVYLGNGWVLSADHVLSGNVLVGGVLYPWVPGSRVTILHDATTPADLAVWRLDPSPSLPLLELRASAPVVSSEAILAGNGLNRGAATSWMGIGGYLWGTGSALRWGTNRIASTGFDIVISPRKTRSFSTDFSAPPPGGPDPRCSAGSACPEAQAAYGDSGGGVFLKSGGLWQLAGIMHSIGGYVGQPASTALYGNPTYSADLSFYRAQILAIVRPECSNGLDDDGDLLVDAADPGCLGPEDDTESPDCIGADADGDGVVDVCDDCLLAPDPDQTDTDGDLFGNACDADYDQDGVVGGTDFNILRAAFGSALGAPNYDARCDSNDDDVIGGADYNFFRQAIGKPPGPSGLLP